MTSHFPIHVVHPCVVPVPPSSEELHVVPPLTVDPDQGPELRAEVREELSRRQGGRRRWKNEEWEEWAPNEKETDGTGETS